MQFSDDTQTTVIQAVRADEKIVLTIASAEIVLDPREADDLVHILIEALS